MNLRSQINPQYSYHQINREERNLTAIFYHALLIGDNLKIFLEDIKCKFSLIENQTGIYFEYAYPRDLWNKINHQGDEFKRKLILDLLQPSNRQELESKSIFDFNTYFGCVPKPSSKEIQSPGNWSIGNFDSFINDNHEFSKVCEFKWCFNAKPDLVIHTSDETAICIEAKFESGEGKYPNSQNERKIFRRRQISLVGQLSIQKKIMDLLGISTQFVFLVQHKSLTHKKEDDVLEITWKEAFANLELSSCPYFIKEWLKRI